MLYVTRPANMRYIADEEFARLRKDVDTCLELLTDVDRPQSPSMTVTPRWKFNNTVTSVRRDSSA